MNYISKANNIFIMTQRLDQGVENGIKVILYIILIDGRVKLNEVNESLKMKVNANISF